MAVVEELSEGFLRKHVADDRLRDALTPRYPFRCKRVLLGEKYYTALQHDHVDLVTDPIDRVTDTSIVTAGGAAVDVDAIVLATGFETSSYLSGLDVIGVGGESLHDRWGSDPQRLSRAWQSAGFRTSSCCTARTPTRAPTRSSTSWRRVRGWSPVR